MLVFSDSVQPWANHLPWGFCIAIFDTLKRAFQGICLHLLPMGVPGNKIFQLMISRGSKHVHRWIDVGGHYPLQELEKTSVESVIALVLPPPAGAVRQIL